MKYLFTLSLIIFSFSLSAQDAKSNLIKIVLTDSVINNHMTIRSNENSDMVKLFHESGYYFFSDGSVDFEGHNCDNGKNRPAGFIKKIKLKKRKATVKLRFPSNNNIRVRLKKDLQNWKIQSRLIYKPWRFPKGQPRIVYYSLDL